MCAASASAKCAAVAQERLVHIANLLMIARIGVGRADNGFHKDFFKPQHWRCTDGDCRQLVAAPDPNLFAKVDQRRPESGLPAEPALESGPAGPWGWSYPPHWKSFRQSYEVFSSGIREGTPAGAPNFDDFSIETLNVFYTSAQDHT